MDLKTELAKPEYAGLTDFQVSERLNERVVLGRQLVPLWRVQEFLMSSGVWPTLKAAALTPSDPRFAVACVVHDMVIAGKFENIDIDRVDTKAALDGLVVSGIITAEQRLALDAMAESAKPRWKNLGISRQPTLLDIRRSRT